MFYIGDTSPEQLEQIKAKLSEIDLQSFNYVTNKIKCFSKSNDQKIVYLGVEHSDELHHIYHKIVDKINESGFDFPYQKYTPHITLGRKVKFKEYETVNNIYCNALTINAYKISVMESKRIDGKIVYKKLFSVNLK